MVFRSQVPRSKPSRAHLAHGSSHLATGQGHRVSRRRGSVIPLDCGVFGARIAVIMRRSTAARATVKNFTMSNRGVATLAEMLRQGSKIATLGAPVAAEVNCDPRSVWPPPSQQRRACRHTDSLLTVAAREDYGSVGQGIDVWRNRWCVPPHPAFGLKGVQLRPQVVGREKEQIGATAG